MSVICKDVIELLFWVKIIIANELKDLKLIILDLNELQALRGKLDKAPKTKDPESDTVCK